MIVYYRARPFPRCRHCRERMSYWVPGLPDEKHAHSECAGKAAADVMMNDLQKRIALALIGH